MFGILFVLIVFGALFIIYFNAKSVEQLNIGDKKVGERAFELFRTYQKGENLLFFLDESANLALSSSTDILASNGGFDLKESKNIVGAPLWFYNGEDLRPKDYKDNFKSIFDTELRKHTSYYSLIPSTFSLDLKSSNPLVVTGISEGYTEIDYSSNYNYNKDTSTNYYENMRAAQLIEYSVSRGAKKIDRIVIHHTGGDGKASDIINVLVTRKLSIHYIIEQDGTVVSVLPESRVAWHAGCLKSDASCLIPDMNSRSIGIEIINTANYNDKFDEQYQSLKKLLQEITKKYDIPYDDEHIIGHYQITTNKWDPAPHFDWAEIGLPNHPTQESLHRSCNFVYKGVDQWGGPCWS